MSRENQIEEMVSDIEQSGMLDSLSRCRIVAEELYLKGYRKQKKGENVSGTPSLYECSVCHWRDIDTYTADTSEYNYCPNCGAKMIIESKYTEDNQ
jgi:rubrerythrin